MSDLFADRVENKRSALQKQLPGQVDVTADRRFVGLDGYQNVIDCVDVVLIACAAKFHPMYAKAGIEAGKHVFVEKPHAIDPAGIKVVEQTSQLARKKNLGLLSGLHSRFDAGYAETIRRVLDGQIGEIVSIEENFIRGPYGNTIRPQGVRELEVQYGNQYRFSWLCGDDVPQSLVHNLDRASWALQGAVPTKCHGLGGRSTSYTLLGDVFDHDSVVYQYDSGVRLYAFCRTIGGCYNESSSIILGSKGIANVTACRITGQNPWRFKGKREDGHLVEQREFSEIDPGWAAPEQWRVYGQEYFNRDHGPVVLLQWPGSYVETGDRFGLLHRSQARRVYLGHGAADETRCQRRLSGMCNTRLDQEHLSKKQRGVRAAKNCVVSRAEFPLSHEMDLQQKRLACLRLRNRFCDAVWV